ncbi:SYCE3 protein, partial [Dasyornis broadbenti]|nr:SYCE3 protein [Dasyornis broadbenti]
MAESKSQERNHDKMEKMIEHTRDLEELLEQMEKNTVHANCLAFNLVAIQTNPDLTNAMKHLEDAFLRCKEKMEKKWQELLME